MIVAYSMATKNINLAVKAIREQLGRAVRGMFCRVIYCLCAIVTCSGCRMSAPIYVWHPQQFDAPAVQRVALAPILADPALRQRLQTAILTQRPLARSDIQLVTSEKLAEAMSIRLVSTAPLSREQTTLEAARASEAQLLLVGEVLQANIDLSEPTSAARNSPRPNSVGHSRPERIAIFWRLIDVASGKPVGSYTLAIDNLQAEKEYPDLLLLAPNPADRVITASARETWKSLSPYIAKENIELSLPWLQFGSAQVRKGNAMAYQGRWDLAEKQWAEAARRHSWNNAAQLNLAIAMAAKEDFPAAKEQLGMLGPIGHKKLQAETLFWIDQRHRWYHTAHRLPPPSGGWSFPDPSIAAELVEISDDVPGPNQQPWWTAIPFTKPPGWTWKAWLSQPWIL